MKTETSLIKKITISDVKNLDPIAVYLEDFNPGQGKITITCYNKSWSNYWNAMGKDTPMSKFFTECDNHYLAEKLAPSIRHKIEDAEGLSNYAKKHIIQRRKEDSISDKEARELYDQCDNLPSYKDLDSHAYANLMYDIFGDEWYDCLPTKINPEYQYFCRILDVVREALKGDNNAI